MCWKNDEILTFLFNMAAARSSGQGLLLPRAMFKTEGESKNGPIVFCKATLEVVLN